MKYILGLLSCVILFSCNNELDLIEEGQDIPIVYGLMSAKDTASYFRVERAFADENISGVELAKDPSQLYYKDLRVVLVHTSSGTEYIHEEVDGADEGYPRDEGAFATVPNTLYKYRFGEMELIEGDRYRLEIDRGESSKIVSGTTQLAKTPKITSPGQTGLISLVPDGPTIVRWRGNETLAIYDLVIEINILEKDQTVAGSTFEPRTLTWNVIAGKIVEPKVTTLEHEFSGANFYSFLSGSLEHDSKWLRNFRDMNVIVFGGGVEMQEYKSVGEANLGITSSQDIPIYTNLSEGRGVFSSVTRVVKEGVMLTGKSIDSLRNNPLTRDLGF